MKTGYSKQIQERINGADDGTIFVNSDFADIADSETTRRNLNRLTQIGMLRRILKGVYEKPKYSKLLDEYVAADPDASCKSIGAKLPLDHRSVWEYSPEPFGALHTGDGGLVLYQRRPLQDL